MRLKKFNTTNAAGRSISTEPRIRINSKGIFTLNDYAVQRMDLKEGDRISLVQDEDSKADWFIAKDPAGFPLSKVKESRSLSIQNAFTARLILSSCELTGSSYSFRMGVIPIEAAEEKLYAIITNSATP